jgi:hypothetical protein
MATAKVPDSFYVTLFSNASQNLYTGNNISGYTTCLAQPVQHSSTDAWEIGICELSYTQPTNVTVKPVVIFGETHDIFCCVLIKPQLVVGGIAHCLRAFIYPSIYCQHILGNVYYLPLDKGKFQDIRIEFSATEGERIKFRDITFPSKVVLHF